MKEVFISYSSVDIAEAETVRNVLEKNELSCWMAPGDIPGGSNYTKEIPIAIRNCKVFVLILSKNAQNSHWVLKELDSAVNNGKVILPFMLEDCVLNDEFNFLLTGAQRYSAYQKKAEAMETLIGRIRGILNVSSPTNEQETLDTPREPAPQKISPQPTNAFEETKCVACGGTDLKELKGKVKRNNTSEKLTLLFIPALAFLCYFVVFIICAFVLPDNLFDLLTILLFVAAALGAIWGVWLSRKIVKRNRLRKGFDSMCYRCNRCGKVFDISRPLDN